MQDRNSIVVIGSGPSGAAAAHALVARGASVILLESGADKPQGLLVRAGSRNLYRKGAQRDDLTEKRYRVTGDKKTDLLLLYQLGGLSNYWTGAIPRFSQDDFCDGERLSSIYRWPVDYADIEPYYDQVEALFHFYAGKDEVPNLPQQKATYLRKLPADWQAVAPAAENLGYGISPLPIADGKRWGIFQRSTAFNSYTEVIEPLLKHPNFTLKTGCHAVRLNYDEQKRQVSEVIYVDRQDNTEHSLAAKAVVVAAGPINSPKLLLQSTSVAFPAGLGNTHGVLGKYLHDHPKEWYSFCVDKPLSRLATPAYITRKRPDLSPPLLANSYTFGNVNGLDKILAFTPLKSMRFGVQTFGTMIPRVENYVALDDSVKDEFGYPQLDLNIHFSEEEVDFMIEGRSRFAEIMADAGYKLETDEIVPQLTPGGSVHYGGTVRMHSDPHYGMVDEWSRLHAVPNVIVADASVFTTGPEKNPTLTAMALAIRAADRLVEDVKQEDAKQKGQAIYA